MKFATTSIIPRRSIPLYKHRVVATYDLLLFTNPFFLLVQEHIFPTGILLWKRYERIWITRVKSCTQTERVSELNKVCRRLLPPIMMKLDGEYGKAVLFHKASYRFHYEAWLQGIYWPIQSYSIMLPCHTTKQSIDSMTWSSYGTFA